MEKERTFTVRVTGYRGCIRVSACTPYHAKQTAISQHPEIDSALFYVQPPIPLSAGAKIIMNKW